MNDNAEETETVVASRVGEPTGARPSSYAEPTTEAICVLGYD